MRRLTPGLLALSLVAGLIGCQDAAEPDATATADATDSAADNTATETTDNEANTEESTGTDKYTLVTLKVPNMT